MWQEGVLIFVVVVVVVVVVMVVVVVLLVCLYMGKLTPTWSLVILEKVMRRTLQLKHT